jgi:hypothetical protein
MNEKPIFSEGDILKQCIGGSDARGKYVMVTNIISNHYIIYWLETGYSQALRFKVTQDYFQLAA